MLLNPTSQYGSLYPLDKSFVIAPVSVCVGRARGEITDDGEFLGRVGHYIAKFHDNVTYGKQNSFSANRYVRQIEDKLRRARREALGRGAISEPLPAHEEILALRYCSPSADLNSTIAGLLGELGLAWMGSYLVRDLKRMVARTAPRSANADALLDKVVVDIADVKAAIARLDATVTGDTIIKRGEFSSALTRISAGLHRVKDSVKETKDEVDNTISNLVVTKIDDQMHSCRLQLESLHTVTAKLQKENDELRKLIAAADISTKVALAKPARADGAQANLLGKRKQPGNGSNPGSPKVKRAASGGIVELPTPPAALVAGAQVGTGATHGKGVKKG
ncbi:hypothetical protein MFIFM68171_03752 [Madurella fahalii]|uniref:Uncharacterized protein n=1 Tax=Madurella fahalii TaxID=1157608 RepID=A0ABQ0G709_9PEZI